MKGGAPPAGSGRPPAGAPGRWLLLALGLGLAVFGWQFWGVLRSLSVPEDSGPTGAGAPAEVSPAGSPPLALAPLTPSEQLFSGLLRGQAPPSIEALRQAAEAFEEESRREPEARHMWVLAQWARGRFGLGPATLKAWDQAMLELLLAQEDPGRWLEVLKAGRLGRIPNSEVPQVWHQWAAGLFSQDRGLFLRGVVEQAVDWADLEGKVVADVGAGCGQLAWALVEVVGEGGQVIAVDIDPSARDLCRFMAARDPGFARIDYRLVAPLPPDPGLKEGEVDLILLMDVHFLGARPGAEGDREVAEVELPWLRAARAALKPGGRLVVYEGGGAAEPLARVRPVLERGGFRVERARAMEGRFGGAVRQGYLILAAPGSEAAADPGLERK